MFSVFSLLWCKMDLLLLSVWVAYITYPLFLWILSILVLSTDSVLCCIWLFWLFLKVNIQCMIFGGYIVIFVVLCSDHIFHVICKIYATIFSHFWAILWGETPLQKHLSNHDWTLKNLIFCLKWIVLSVHCTFPCVPHILYWHCPSILGKGGNRFLHPVHIFCVKISIYEFVFQYDLSCQVGPYYFLLRWSCHCLVECGY